MNETLTTSWHYPTNVHVGPGTALNLPAICQDLSLQTLLLVTDSGLLTLEKTQHLLSTWQRSGLTLIIYSDIQADPGKSEIDAGVTVFHQHQCQGVIAFGGGSAIDAAKAIALMSGQSLTLWAFEDIGDNWQKVRADGIAPIIALPTTAGTGSEVGRASVITDHNAQLKRIIFHPNMLPQQVILDPDLTLGLPPGLTGATGMDALSHNLEAYCANGYHPMADGIAIQGIKLIKDNLVTAYNDGTDVNARMQMLVASTMGATAFQKGLGAMHALSHPLGAVYHAHHGRLNAILMPYVLLANRPAIEARINQLADFLSIPGGFTGFIEWVLNLRRALAIEPCLADLGIDDQHIERIALNATQDAASAGNPITFSKTDYQHILAKAITGEMR